VTFDISAYQAIIYIFWRYIKSNKEAEMGLKTSEKMLFKLIEEMPVVLSSIIKTERFLSQ